MAASDTRWPTRHSYAITVAFCIGCRHSFSNGYCNSFSVRCRLAIGDSYSFARGFPNSITARSRRRCDLANCNAFSISGCFAKR